MSHLNSNRPATVDRRAFLKASMTSAAVAGTSAGCAAQPTDESDNKPDDKLSLIDDFHRADSLYHGDGWESLNPGYWKIENSALRRRLQNVGQRARKTGFPFHWETHKNRPMPMQYDPSLPFGMLWRRSAPLTGNFRIRIELTVKALRSNPPSGDNPQWQQHQPGYALMGICFGSQSLFEGWHGRGKPGSAAWMALWRDNATFGIYDHATDQPKTARKKSEQPAPALKPGERVTIDVTVSGNSETTATLTAVLRTDSSTTRVECSNVDRKKFTDGHFGIVARGLLDFEVNRVEVNRGTRNAGDEESVEPLNELHVAYPLGETLKLTGGKWQCRFVALFRSDGGRAEIRVSDSPNPRQGWQSVPVAGAGEILNNNFRRNTAVVDVTLPANPADKTLYYTVFKDGKDVTSDPRSGWLGKKSYVGRLPRLKAPYRLCGLSCHAINVTSDLPRSGLFQENWIHDQPTADAFKHVEEFDFQVMVWEDDVWYLELVIYPPSTDDAYKIITETIAGPTTRWQMMRHWNVVNPGDHDHGMDDVKGPEQVVIRNHDDLGQDAEYMRRNFQIVSHLMRGDERPSGTENPKRWRRWKMPDRDFTLLLIDSRLWRTSQDTHIWDDEGWGHKKNLYDRTDPTRALLGEEQFAWLGQIIRNDTSPIICLTGINGLHTIWTGHKKDPETGLRFNQRDRVAADFAGWVKQGADRVIELLSSRSGIVSVYGDVHNGCIMKNVEQRLYECSFGPIGRYGGRMVKENFGPTMRDYDGRSLEIIALYHRNFGSPELKPLAGPKYWNFLEMHFDPRGVDQTIGLKLRNLIDAPKERPRGGGTVDEKVSETGRPITCKLPPIKMLPNADVRITTTDGRPLRGTRTLPDGSVPLQGLPDVKSGTKLLMTCYDGQTAQSTIVATVGM